MGTVKKAPSNFSDAPAGAMSLYELEVTSLSGEKVALSDFKGKKLVIVNTASKCGFTNQYDDLQKLHEKHGDKVVLIGVPSNDFGNQEPGGEKDIQEFCRLNYGVSFLMLEKLPVKGKEKSPLYQWLTDPKQNGWNDQEPKWNFCKYIINEDGKLTHFFGSSVTPFSEKFMKALEI
ncbi:glutathione peroxidase [Cytophagaceae bacterium ABcell3]|nr:glutathione peroxidase [Cytophagaceae bacterium ABcell3]